MVTRWMPIFAVTATVAFFSSNAQPAGAREPLRARACDARRLAEKALHLELKMSNRLLEDAVIGAEFRGYLLSGDGAFDEVDDPGLALSGAFEDAGWVAVAGYQADGPDGTAGAFEKPGIRCLYEIGWNGYVEGEPDSLESTFPAQGHKLFRVNIFCYRPPSD